MHPILLWNFVAFSSRIYSSISMRGFVWAATRVMACEKSRMTFHIIPLHYIRVLYCKMPVTEAQPSPHLGHYSIKLLAITVVYTFYEQYLILLTREWRFPILTGNCSKHFKDMLHHIHALMPDSNQIVYADPSVSQFITLSLKCIHSNITAAQCIFSTAT
jgi:hypothetical protein